MTGLVIAYTGAHRAPHSCFTVDDALGARRRHLWLCGLYPAARPPQPDRSNPFGGFGTVLSVVLALVILQVLSSGLNLLGANQHLATALWDLLLVGVMILSWVSGRRGLIMRR